MSSTSLEYFQARLKIDKDNLDEELAEFPTMFYAVSDQYVDADRHSKRLAQRVERERLSIISALRDAAETQGEKITETQLKQEASLHPKIQKLSSRLRQSEKRTRRWELMKEAFVQKSYSLKGLVSLSMHENYQQSHANPEGETKRRRR